MFDLIVQIKAKSAQDHQQIQHHLRQLAHLCPKEPGCERWQAFACSEDPNGFFVIESWQSKQHWQDHMSFEAFVTHYEKGILSLIERNVYFVEPI
jgi:quinol monooxygenase YgiN